VRFGGTTVAVVDNLKEGVFTPDIYDPALNPLYRGGRRVAARRDAGGFSGHGRSGRQSCGRRAPRELTVAFLFR
jgi:hypothetical protein